MVLHGDDAHLSLGTLSWEGFVFQVTLHSPHSKTKRVLHVRERDGGSGGGGTTNFLFHCLYKDVCT